MLGTAAITGAARIENDMLDGSIADDEHLGFLGVQSVLVSPLTCDETVHGVLALYDNEDGGFSEESLNLVRVLSTQAARVVAAMQDEPAQPDTPAAQNGFVDMADLL
jgi:GAF domain-containing protein